MNASEAHHLIKKINENPQFELMEPLSYLLYQLGSNIPASMYIDALNRWDQVGLILSKFHQKYDLYLTPTVNGIAPLIKDVKIDSYITKIKNSKNLAFEEQLKLLKDVFSASLERTPFTQLANLTGQPAISLPTSESKEGMPIGVQFMAPNEREDLLLYIGKMLSDNGFLK